MFGCLVFSLTNHDRFNEDSKLRKKVKILHGAAIGLDCICYLTLLAVGILALTSVIGLSSFVGGVFIGIGGTGFCISALTITIVLLKRHTPLRSLGLPRNSPS